MQLRQLWSRSRVYQAILVVALVYTALRLIVHGAYLGMMLNPSSGLMGGMPEWTGSEGNPLVPVDLQIYLDAAERFLERRPLYLRSNRIEIYQYPPFYAFAFIPFTRLPPVTTVIIHSLLHVGAYALLYVTWDRIFSQLGFDRVHKMLAWTLPVWLIFSSFWSDLSYLNIYVVVALLGSSFIAAILKERLGWSVFWLTLILQVKPHWAFAAVIPLLLGRYRFLLKLGALTLLASVIVTGVVMLIGGPAYVWQQHVDYVQFMPHLVEDFPWRTPDNDFLGYNHSVKQIIFYVLGVSPWSRRLITGTKAILMVPLGIISWRLLLQPQGTPPSRIPQLALDIAFVLYLGVFICLDMVWEASLAIALFAYLLATLERPWTRVLTWVVFLPYALIDLWQLLSLGLFGIEVIAPGPYVLTDPSIYIPIVMVVIITFYALLIQRVWKPTSALQTEGAKV